MIETNVKAPRVLIASIVSQYETQTQTFNQLKEIHDLVKTVGGKVEDYILQKRELHDKGLYLGRGKLVEVAEIIKEKNIDIIVFNGIVKPSHLFDMKKMLIEANKDIILWDKVALILEIFAKHASTTEAHLQIDLAAMDHMGPRIYGMGFELSRQTGGIGARGIGETNTELMKRHWRKQKNEVEERLLKLEQNKKRQLEQRLRNGLKTVSIVGYTNAGKTSLFNLLTGKDKLVKNILFATLDSATGKVKLNENTSIILSDTIGFIQNLPAKLVKAFKSTLMESINADLLLHTIDSSDQDLENKINTVLSILKELGLEHKKQIFVFNKTDLIDKDMITSLEEKYKDYTMQFISVNKNTGIENLLKLIEKNI